MITFILFLLVVLLVFGSTGTSVFKKGHCRLKWNAVYHVSGQKASLQINETWIDSLGHCIAHSPNNQNYIFRLELGSGTCYRCVVIFGVHPNVLQYKQSGCMKRYESSDYDIDVTCRHMFRGDTPMKTLFRSDAKAEQCPFKVPFNFTYTTQDGSCTSRISSAIACSMQGKYRFQYQACPELPDSETYVDELECIAYWISFGIEFFAVRIINSSITRSNTVFRCLIHQRTVFGGRMGISADSSCNELTDLTYAGTTIDYTMIDLPLKPRCHFPSFLQHGHHSSDRQQWISMTTSSMHHFVKGEWVESLNEANYSVAKCLHREDLGSVHKMLIHITKECDSGFQCLKVKRRHENVVEITRSGLMEEAPDSCNVIDEHIIDTMVLADAEMTRCLMNRLNSLAPCASHHPTLQFGCTNEYKMVIQRKYNSNTSSGDCSFLNGVWRRAEIDSMAAIFVILFALIRRC